MAPARERKTRVGAFNVFLSNRFAICAPVADRSCFYFFVTSSPPIRHLRGVICYVRSTILSVDDEHDVTDLVKFHLTRIGHEVITAASGREALDIVRAHPPDLIILDLMLPDIDGFGVCEILRRQPATATIPIIILSAWATTDARLLGLELGALDYLTKPFSPKEMVVRVERLLSLRDHPVAPGHSGSS